MKKLLLCSILLTSLNSFGNDRIITLKGEGWGGSSWNPVCLGLRHQAKKEAKENALEKCSRIYGRYIKTIDKDSSCRINAGGACGCSAYVAIECSY